MSETFDPYHKWLGIAPKDQPANHHRLLGIDLLECDPDVISNAADQRMAHVRTFQTGEHSAVSQQILNEISVARVCLLDPENKAQYDAALVEAQKAPRHATPEENDDLELEEEPEHERAPDDWDSIVLRQAVLLESLKAGQAGAGYSQPAEVSGEPSSREDPRGEEKAHIEGRGDSSAEAQLFSRPPAPGPTKVDEPVSIAAGSFDRGEKKRTFSDDLEHYQTVLKLALAALAAGLSTIGFPVGRDTPHANGPAPDTERPGIIGPRTENRKAPSEANGTEEAPAVAAPQAPEALPSENGAAKRGDMTLQVQQGFCRFPLNHASESPRRDPKLWRNAFAEKILQRSWTQPGPSAAAYFKQGLVFMDQGKLQSAIVCLNEAIQLDPQYGEA